MRPFVTLIGVSFAAVALLFVLSQPSLTKLDQQELVGLFGGACYTCVPQPGACTYDECKKSDASHWTSKVGTDITQMFCFNVSKGSSGLSECSTSDTQPCVSIKVCTDDKCTKCGTPGTEYKDTKCSLTGQYCVGQ